ncbi:MAG: calcium-binding protein [Pseudomonadota bacterium]
MVTFNASASDAEINLTNGLKVAFGTSLITTPTLFQYLAQDGNTAISFTGTFGYSGSTPTSGTVSRIDFDFGNDDTVDAVIDYTGFSQPSVADLIAGDDEFWAAALGTSDTIIPSEVPAPGFVSRDYVGDFLTISSGMVMMGGDDQFSYAGGGGQFVNFFADANSNRGTLTGGADTVSYLATQPGGVLYLDVNINSSGGVLVGGADTVSTTAPAGISQFGTFTVYGDANSTFNQLTGGDDNIETQYASNARIYGDVRSQSNGTVVGGNDTIRGSDYGSDEIYGDVATISNGSFTGGNDTIEGGAGDDMIFGDYGELTAGTIVSGGNDIIDGGSGDDTIFGNEGNDTITGGLGGDDLDGGDGIDTVSYEISNGGVNINLSLNTASNVSAGVGEADGDTITGFENIIGSAHDDQLTGLLGETSVLAGLDGDDVLIGGSASDLLAGGVGHDTMQGGLGADTMIGDVGNDTYQVENAGDIILENVDEGDDIVDTFITYNVPMNVEVLRMQGGDDIDSTGTDGRDQIFGNSGANIINGAGGIDVMAGGTGNDVYAVDNSSDAVVEATGEGFDNVYSSIDYIISETSEIESALITGTATVLRGSNSDNQLIGNDQVNVIDGRGGTDYMLGGLGNDIFQIGPEDGAVDIIGDFTNGGPGMGDRIAFTGFNEATSTVTQVSSVSFIIEDTSTGTSQQFQLFDAYGAAGYTGGELVAGEDYYFG